MFNLLGMPSAKLLEKKIIKVNKKIIKKVFVRLKKFLKTWRKTKVVK